MNVDNQNTKEYLERVRKLTFERLKLLESAPGMQVSAEVRLTAVLQAIMVTFAVP